MGDFVRSFGQTVRALRGHIDRALSSHGVRFGQYQVLSCLWERDGLTPRELAQQIAVEMPTVTRTVQRMLRDGLVRREDHPDDGRSVKIFLTSKAQELQPLAQHVLDESTEAALRGFTGTDREELIALLERILRNLR